jgi:hypothetical protein
MPRHGTARRLDLARGETAAADCLQTELAKADLVAPSRLARVAALLFLAVFTSGWL